jgi:hypothetical protein
MIATMTRPGKLSRKYRNTLTTDGRAALMAHLTHGRLALAGRLEYNSKLADRTSILRKLNASCVIRLVLNRCA